MTIVCSLIKENGIVMLSDGLVGNDKSVSDRNYFKVHYCKEKNLGYGVWGVLKPLKEDQQLDHLVSEVLDEDIGEMDIASISKKIEAKINENISLEYHILPQQMGIHICGYDNEDPIPKVYHICNYDTNRDGPGRGGFKLDGSGRIIFTAQPEIHTQPFIIANGVQQLIISGINYIGRLQDFASGLFSDLMGSVGEISRDNELISDAYDIKALIDLTISQLRLRNMELVSSGWKVIIFDNNNLIYQKEVYDISDS